MIETSIFAILILVLVVALFGAAPMIASRKGYAWIPWTLTGVPGIVATCLLWQVDRGEATPDVRLRRRWRANAFGTLLSLLTIIACAWRVWESKAQAIQQETGRRWELLDDEAKAAMKRGDYVHASTVAQQALSLAEQNYGLDSAPVAVSLNNLAAILQHEGRYGDAEHLLKRALDIQLHSVNPNDHDLAAHYYNLAWNYEQMNQDAPANLYYWKSLGVLQKPGKPFDPAICRILIALSRVSRREKNDVQAESLLKRASTNDQQRLPHDHPDLIYAQINLGTLYLDQQRYVEAEAVFLKVVAVVEQSQGPQSPALIEPLMHLIKVYQVTGRSVLARQQEQKLKKIPNAAN